VVLLLFRATNNTNTAPREDREVTMRTHCDDLISSAGRERRVVLALIELLLCCAPAAKADSGWAATATQGMTLANFTISAHSLGPLHDMTAHLARVTVTDSEGATASAAVKVKITR
jgi:hypothetical protein